MWIDRDISPRLVELSRAFPALILTGARQTGKTSLLRRLFKDYHYVSLDSRVLAEQSEQSPKSFLQEHPPPVIIDEVQYAPELFRHLKVAIDADRHHKGRFILTGSQKFTLMKEVSDSLAGRCAILSLPGLTVQEIRRSGWSGEEVRSQTQLLVRGGFPELWAEPAMSTRDYYQAYVSTYLERDLRQILNVGNLRDFERFIRACAARCGQLLNKSQLARDVGISQSTASDWISALEASNQVTLLEPYFANVGKRLVKSPKLYFNETGLLCFLLGLTPEALGQSPMIGFIWENFVLAELVKWVNLNHPEWAVWFYRDQQNREADFLVQGPHDHVRIMDAKWSEIPKSSFFSALNEIAGIVMGSHGVETAQLALIGRAEGIKEMADRRHLVSGFAVSDFLSRL